MKDTTGNGEPAHWNPTNREKARGGKRKRFWCACDRNHVTPGGKCVVCKRKDPQHKLREVLHTRE